MTTTTVFDETLLAKSRASLQRMQSTIRRTSEPFHEIYALNFNDAADSLLVRLPAEVQAMLRAEFTDLSLPDSEERRTLERNAQSCFARAYEMAERPEGRDAIEAAHRGSC